MLIRRGDIFYADLRPVVGSEQGGVRPVLIIQNDVGNRHSPTVICAAITSQMNKAKLPTHVELDCTKYALVKVEVLVFQVAQVATVNGVSPVAPKLLYIEVMGTHTDFTIEIDSSYESLEGVASHV